MRTETLLVTPQMAAEMLRRNPRNRCIRRSNVRFLSTELKEGRWKHTHQGLAVGKCGTLLDGQHRLTAIVETGIPALMNVSFDCDAATFAVIDTGAIRGSSDVLRINGVTSCETSIAATVKLYWLYHNKPSFTWTGEASRLSSAVVLEEYRRDPEGFSWAVKLSHRAKYEFKALKLASATATFAYLAVEHGFDRQEIEAFVMSVATGANLEQGDPRYAIRKQLINGWDPGQSKGARGSQVWVACWIRLFNLYLLGATTKLFKLPNFPPMPKFEV